MLSHWEQLSNCGTRISPTIKKYGPQGSTTGRERHIDDIISSIAGIVKLCVCHGFGIHALIVYFRRVDGRDPPPYRLGEDEGELTLTEIPFGPDEYITCVRGCISPSGYVISIEIKTNYTVYGPYGYESHTYTSYEFKAFGGQIIGFHGRSGKIIDAIGVYVKGEETILAQEAHLREQAQKELAIAHINMESSLKLLKKKNEATMEKLKKLSDKLKEVEESRTYFPLVRKEDGKAFREAFNVLSEMQNLLNAKEKDHQEILKSYHKVSCAHAKLYHKVLDENKLINKLTEDRSSTSYGMVKFTEFTCLEIEAATKDSVCVGMGGYGKVYQALLGGTTVAIKIPKEGSNQGGREFNQEVEVLGRIQHQNLVTLIGACPELYALVYEFLPNGSLEDRLKDTKTFSWKERIKIAASICSALLFLHNMKPNPVAHGDLKPSNILFDSNNVCKLSDFGISRVLRYTNDTITPKHETMEPRGTYCYIDPEFLQTGTLTPQSDVFAFGIVLLQLVTAKAPMGLRNTILNALDCKNLEALRTSSKNKTLENFMDTNFVDPPIDDIMKITCLGLQCSDPLRKNRPDLETEVWSEIMSINGFASVS